jgi:hypothetical protein
LLEVLVRTVNPEGCECCYLDCKLWFITWCCHLRLRDLRTVHVIIFLIICCYFRYCLPVSWPAHCAGWPVAGWSADLSPTGPASIMAGGGGGHGTCFPVHIKDWIQVTLENISFLYSWKNKMKNKIQLCFYYFYYLIFTIHEANSVRYCFDIRLQCSCKYSSYFRF